ncbi:MAG: hypothetical protein IPM97_17525 [Bdellovibrionaceae bacterium]|nr:hypothetical protein [Pseudobdellovibrionaceae bacterium]
MLKKFVALFACLGLVVQLSSCTSKDSKEDGGDMAVDAAAMDSAEVEKVEGGENLDITADDSGASLSGEALPEDALGETTAASGEDPMATVEKSTMDVPADAGAPAQDTAASEPPPTVDLPADTLGDSSLPAESVVETSTSGGDSSASVASELPPVAKFDEPKQEPKPMASYRKVESTPWTEGGKLLNTVYVSRDGDTWKSVSTMIYGSEKVSELKKMNPAIKSRKLKAGDKVYYNSPHRPEDSNKVLVYYEDNGMAPEVYIAKSGDNLKTVAKELFGSKEAWKELYATNEFESKGSLDEGTQIKYWRGAPPPMKSEVVAAAPPPIEASAPPMESAPPVAEMPPPQPGEMAPPPPPPPEMAMNDVPPPPPPPPVEAIAPPPPPPPPPMKAVAENNGEISMGEDQTQMLAAGAIVFVGLALFIMLRRRRRRELEQAIQDTQVG